MELKTFFAQDETGKVIPGAWVHVHASGTTDPVSGLRDRHGNPLTNPFRAEESGQIQLQAPNGMYDLHVSCGPRLFTLPVKFFDLEDVGAMNVVAQGSSDSRSLARWAAAIRQRILRVNALEDLQALDTEALDDGQQANVLSYHSPAFPSPTFFGGGPFAWSPGDHSGDVAADPGRVLYAPPHTAPSGASGCWVRQCDGRSINLRWAGAVGDGVTDDSEAFQNAWRASVLLGKVPVDVPPPPDEYLITHSLDIGTGHFLHLRGDRSQRARGGSSASGHYQNTCINWQPKDPTNWLVDDFRLGDGYTGPYIIEDLTIKAGGNGVRFGRADADEDGVDDSFEDGGHQRYVFGAYVKGCQFHSTQDMNCHHHEDGTLDRHPQVLVAFAKAFESGIEDTSFYGSGTQIDLYGCDRPVIDKVRGGACQVGIRLRGVGSFSVDHLIRAYQIENYSLAAIINDGCVLGTSDLRIEAQSAPANEPRVLAATARVTEGSGTLYCSADMSRTLFAGISVITLTHSLSGETHHALVTGVDGAKVSIYHNEDYIRTPFSDGRATIIRYHGYALLANSRFDTSVVAGSFNPVSNAPVFVYVANRGAMHVSEAKRQRGLEEDSGSMVIGNRSGESRYMNARLAFVNCTPNVCASSSHPLVTINDASTRHTSDEYSGAQRTAFGSQADLAMELTRPTWVHTPKSSGTTFSNSNAVTFTQVVRDEVAGTRIWAWKKTTEDSLYIRDETFPSTPSSYLRVRVLCRAISSSGELPYFFEGVGGTSKVTLPLTAEWKIVEVVRPMPDVWQSAATRAKALRFGSGPKSGAYIAGVSVEELLPGDGGFVAGTWESPMRFGSRCVWFDAKGNMLAKNGPPASDSDGIIISREPII